MQRRLIACVIAAGILGFAGVAHSAATSNQTADRMEGGFIYLGGDPEPPPTAEEVCNNRQYYGWDSGPPHICFTAIAQELGWSTAKINLWDDWVILDPWSVTQGEAMQCWNVRGGELVDRGDPCEQKYQYRRITEDTGFGQMTYVLYGPRGYLCTHHGYCGSASILRSPYHSMKPVLLMIDLGRPNGGSDPWCFSADARAYHQCWRAPDR